MKKEKPPQIKEFKEGLGRSNNKELRKLQRS